MKPKEKRVLLGSEVKQKSFTPIRKENQENVSFESRL